MQCACHSCKTTCIIIMMMMMMKPTCSLERMLGAFKKKPVADSRIAADSDMGYTVPGVWW